MRLKVNEIKGYKLAGVTLIVLALTATSAKSALPPPPDGPPAPILTGIAVSGTPVVDEGDSAQYVCTASYSDGTKTAVAAVWSEDSAYATINGSGNLSAGNVEVDQDVSVTATYSGFMATLDVTIQYVVPVLTSIAIDGPIVLDEEATAQYVCTATYSDGSSGAVIPSWSENAAAATISGSGLLSANNVAADQNVTITATYDGQSDTHSVTIKDVPAVLTGVTISGPTSLNEETTAQYVCTATYSDGTSGIVSPSWSENSSSATISGSGLLNALNISADKNVTITAAYGGQSDSHAVTIKYVVPELTGITITGPTWVDEESSAQYICTATYSDGTSAVVVPGWGENSGFASINASGVLVTGNVAVDQGVTLTANYGGKVDTHAVTINYVAPPVTLTGIAISGTNTVEENTTAQFSCTATYSDGSIATVMPVWSENSASAGISASGLLSIGNVEIDDSLLITATFEGKVADQLVDIWVVGTQVIYPLSGFGTIKAELWDDSAQEWRDMGEAVDPDEIVITDVDPRCWYWLRIKEYDADLGVWVQVHTNWISM